METEWERRQRAARREYIRAHHPDVGGDPDAFATGLRRFDSVPTSVTGHDGPRVQVRRSNRPDRVVRRLMRQVLDARAGRPRRKLN